MILRFLTLMSCLQLCTFTSCEDDCFDFFIRGGVLEVALENSPSVSYGLGDTLWLAADFSAALEGEQTTITEAGGIFVSRVFRIGPDSTSLLPALTAFTPLAAEGDFVPESNNRDPAATVLRYRCPQGRCGFRQGFRLDSVGQYLLEVTGSDYDRELESGSRCMVNGFSETVLAAPSNLAGVSLSYPLRYLPADESIREGFIDTSFQRNTLFFIVE